MSFIVTLGTWITDHPKLFCVLLALGSCLLGVGIGRKLQQGPASLQETATASGAAFGREDLTRKTEEGPSRVTERIEDYAICKGRRDLAARDAEPADAQHALRRVVTRVTEKGPSVTETHSEAESAQSTTQTLKLTQEGSSAAQWALSAGFENVLHDKKLRLAARRRLFGPFWAEVTVTPATRAVGAGLSVEW